MGHKHILTPQNRHTLDGSYLSSSTFQGSQCLCVPFPRLASCARSQCHKMSRFPLRNTIESWLISRTYGNFNHQRFRPISTNNYNIPISQGRLLGSKKKTMNHWVFETSKIGDRGPPTLAPMSTPTCTHVQMAFTSKWPV